MTQSTQDYRIAISGTYGVGKTTLTAALERATGIPMTFAPGMRDLLPIVHPQKTLLDLEPFELFQLGITRYTERVCGERMCGRQFFSDGSTLHEYVYAKGREVVGAHGPNTKLTDPAYLNAVEAFAREQIRHARETYTHAIHLPVEFPLHEDGHRPVSEEFRQFANEFSLQLWRELEIPVYEVRGSLDERVAQVVNVLGLPLLSFMKPQETPAGSLYYAHMDDTLGPSKERYLAHGFRNTYHRIHDVIISPNEGLGKITALIDLDYRGPWSQKSGNVPKGHFTTPDAVLVGGQLSQALLFTQDGLTREQSNNMWLRRYRLDTSKPIEEVRNIPVVHEITKSNVTELDDGPWRFVEFSGDFGEGRFVISTKVAYKIAKKD